jgi:hypothetical protein
MLTAKTHAATMIGARPNSGSDSTNSGDVINPVHSSHSGIELEPRR